MIVVESPAVDRQPGSFQAQEQLAIRKLVSQLAVKALPVAIFPGATLGGDQRLVKCITPRTRKQRLISE